MADELPTNIMKHSAINTRVMQVVLDVDAMRYPQPSDRFKLELTTDARQYVVVNKIHSTEYVVTFAVAANGKKLGSCTCADFAQIRRHSKQCKHIRLCYDFHVSRMKVRQTVKTVKPITDYKSSSIYSCKNGIEKIGGIRI